MVLEDIGVVGRMSFPVVPPPFIETVIDSTRKLRETFRSSDLGNIRADETTGGQFTPRMSWIKRLRAEKEARASRIREGVHLPSITEAGRSAPRKDDTPAYPSKDPKDYYRECPRCLFRVSELIPDPRDAVDPELICKKCVDEISAPPVLKKKSHRKRKEMEGCSRARFGLGFRSCSCEKCESICDLENKSREVGALSTPVLTPSSVISKENKEALRKWRAARRINLNIYFPTLMSLTEFRCFDCNAVVDNLKMVLPYTMGVDPRWTCGGCAGMLECIVCRDEAPGTEDETLNDVEFLKSYYCKRHYNARIDEFKIYDDAAKKEGHPSCRHCRLTLLVREEGTVQCAGCAAKKPAKKKDRRKKREPDEYEEMMKKGGFANRLEYPDCEECGLPIEDVDEGGYYDICASCANYSDVSVSLIE